VSGGNVKRTSVKEKKMQQALICITLTRALPELNFLQCSPGALPELLRAD